MVDEEIGLRTSLKDRRQTVAGLKDVSGAIDNTGDRAARAGRQATIGARGFDQMHRAGRLAGRGIGLAFAATAGAGYVAVRLLQDSFGEAREAQKVGALTAQLIKTTGGVANVSAKQVERLSGAISEKIGVDDEAIQTGANLLLTFKNVRNEAGAGSKIFNRATQDSTDLAASGFGSIESGAKTLGKALQDPTKGIAALSKQGVTFTQEQKDTIASLVEQNDLLGAQKLILHEVEGQVKGAAQAQATLGDKAEVAFGNIKERLGTILLPELNQLQRWFLRDGIPAISTGLDIFESKGVPAIRNFVRQARPLAKEVGPALVTTFESVRDVLSELAPYAEDVVEAFNDMPSWAKKAIAVGGVGALAGKKAGVFDLLGSTKSNAGGSGLLGLVSKAKPMPVFVTNPGFGTGVELPGSGGKPTAGGAKPAGPLGWLTAAALPGVATLGANVFSERAMQDMADSDSARFGFDVTDKAESEKFIADSRAKLAAQAYSGMELINQTSRLGLSVVAAQFKTLPSELQTDIVLHGAPESKAEVKDLVKTYDLTKAQRNTLFTTYGIPRATLDTSDFKSLLTETTARPWVTQIDANTGVARSSVFDFVNMLNSIPPTVTTTIRTIKVGPSTSEVEPHPSIGGGPTVGSTSERMTTNIDRDWADFDPAPAHRTIEIPVNLDGREVGRGVWHYTEGEMARQ